MSEPDDPEAPAPKILGLLVWIVMLFFALCVAAGAAVAWLVPRL